MPDGQRVRRSKAASDRGASNAERPGATSARAPAPSAEWAAAHLGSAFPLGVQRKVEIGPAGDAYEREADRVASDVASGRSIKPSAISPIGSLPAAGAQRATDAKKTADDKKKDEKPKTPAPAVQKAATPAPDKKPEPKKPDEKKADDKPKAAAAPSVQKADKPAADKKPEPKKPDEKKKDDKPKTAAAPSVQKADKPPADKKPEPKKADDKRKDDKPKTAAPPVQKANTPADKKADEKKAEDKKNDTKNEKRHDDKPKAAAAIQKAAAADAPETSETPKKKDKKDEHPKSLSEKLESAPVQRAADGSTATPSMEAAAARAIQTKGAGEPMHTPTRSALESRMGVDLGGVRVHQDRSAHDTADAISARAFTHGSDIWLGRGQSQADTSLMAHEATHVVQQAGGVHRMVQRDEKKKKKGKGSEPPGGKVEDKRVTIFDLHIPAFKGRFKPATDGSYEFKKPEPRGDQRQFWHNKLETQVKGALPSKLGPLPGIVKGTEGAEEAKPDEKNKTYFLQIAGGEGAKSYLIGTASELADEFIIPRWGPKGNPTPLDVDHKQELQLGGAALDMENLWLLNASANRSSGAKISNEIKRKIASATEDEVDKGTWAVTPTLDELLDQKYTVFAEKITADVQVAGEPDSFWEQGDITGIDRPLAQLKALTVKQAIARNLVGDKSQLLIYPLPSGGRPRKVKWDPNKESADVKQDDFFKGFNLESVTYEKGGGKGSIKGLLFPNKKKKKVAPVPQPLEMDLVDLGSLPYTTTVAPGNLRQGMKFAALQGLSPIEFQEAGLDDQGVMARGKLKPSLPMFKDLEIDILVSGEDVTLSKTFTKDEFNLPGPIKVTGANLTVSISTSELAASGEVLFAIDRVGKGQLNGRIGTSGGLEVSGQFDFDSELFDPATVKVGYAEGKFSGSGDIGIKEGKVKGIKSASLNVTIDGDKISATGSVKPNIPAVEEGKLSFSYDPQTGIVIGGSLELKKDIPGLEGGSVDAELSKKPGDEKWRVKASGEATPKIPGVSSKLAVSYDDGAFDAVVTAGYEKGMLKGSITVGATNRPVGDDGKPAGPPPDKGDKVTLYGGGSVTLRIAPWLQATAAIKLLPNGEIEVTGEIGLPAALEIFKEKKLDKNIFKIGIDIPIVGVSVAGQRIGILANITGGLDLEAGIGPGELNQLKLSVTYNPTHEENTKVSGDANLHIPAHAGLRLFVRGSLGVGIPIVSASAGLEIGGALGLEGALDAGVHVDWTPTTGLDLTAQASIYVEPKLKFDISGFVLVEADLLLTTIELYSKKWQLAAFEYGSGLRFGLKFPIHYQEGKPFDISLSDVEFEVPQIDPGELLGGLIKKIA